MPLAHAAPAATPALQAQLPNSATILARMHRLGRVATVLYVAAHPDDENSRLLAWLAGERGLRAVYLSLTRGDGGQNLIGAEQDELLGLLRTWELMAARSVDGPGDRVAESLQAVGHQVSVLSEAQLAKDDLSEFKAIAVGVRALNAQPKLVAHWPKLLRWVEAGGRLAVQYQTNSRVGPLTVAMGPYPLEIGRDRVTDETAAIRWEAAAPPEIRGGPTQNPLDTLCNSPNQLGESDFAGWVQERGLYFAKSWDPRYLTPLRMKDPGEADQAGALLVAPHGKGQFIYTGLAFFRQLPAGVPGAYRLFANLLGP